MPVHPESDKVIFEFVNLGRMSAHELVVITTAQRSPMIVYYDSFQ